MKKISKSTIAIITVIAVLGVTVLTLGLIRVRPDKYFFEDYKYFQVYDLGSNTPYASVEEQVAPKLKTVRFSVLGAILEGQGGYSPRLLKDSDGEPQYFSVSDIKNNKISATADRYLLHFVYDGEPREIEVGGEKYLYDRAYVFIQEGNGEIKEVRVIPYVADRVHNDSNGVDSSDLYNIPELRIKMRTSKLYVAMRDAIAALAA